MDFPESNEGKRETLISKFDHTADYYVALLIWTSQSRTYLTLCCHVRRPVPRRPASDSADSHDSSTSILQLRDRRENKCDVNIPEGLISRYKMALQIPLSGPLSLETTLPPKLDAGAKSHIFQPPRTPSASTSLHRSSAFLLSQHGNVPGSRKRARKDSYLAEEPLSNTYDASAWSPMESVLHSSMTCPGSPDEMSPAPLVNTQYKLAGGLDTPTAALSSTLERYDCYATLSDPAMRGPGRGWGRNSGIGGDSYFPQITPTMLGREANGRPRFHSASSQLQQHQQYQEYQESNGGGFAKTVLTVAGKVWEFCKASAFRGFYAGGGQGFDMLPPSHSERSTWEDSSEPKDYNFSQMNPIPGRFPTEELKFIPDYMSRNYHHQRQETSPSRPAKKHQREKPGSRTELQASWVLVGPHDASSLSRESSPSRPSLRKYHPSRRTLTKPSLHRPRPSSSYAGSPSLSHPHASTASQRASSTSPSKNLAAAANSSPVNVEVARHAARIRKREAEEEANLQRLNRQLKALIKEGKEALGTKYEIEMGEDEGYAEGEEYLFEEGVVEKG